MYRVGFIPHDQKESEGLVLRLVDAGLVEEPEAKLWLLEGYASAQDWEKAKQLAVRLESLGFKAWPESVDGIVPPPPPSVVSLLGRSAKLDLEKGNALVSLCLLNAILGLIGSALSWGPLAWLVMIYLEGGIIFAAAQLAMGDQPGFRSSLAKVDRKRFYNLFGANFIILLPILAIAGPVYVFLDENTPDETIFTWTLILTPPVLIYLYLFLRAAFSSMAVILLGLTPWQSIVFSWRLTGFNQGQALFRLVGLGMVTILFCVPSIVMMVLGLLGEEVLEVLTDTMSSILIVPSMVLLFNDLRFRMPPAAVLYLEGEKETLECGDSSPPF